ncbi:pyrimidine-specific ribonucleoside hydrolase RihA [Liquorilactobacillus mali]|uniref:Ribonucleoside hydrolase 1 n=1 Tax=Liquorilactobacillus mali KCTC 3596 = DSM 20444 TaxID=1046596 RepID=J0L132_9LACO|nr:pyrimidine-specific ribonucleoside hydrolase RihA [Liquorilactobacillus mali]EJF01291.1 ribonucleoside hydrolase 1 [Liquorilactobacillus mali KCTC 3596 = DSM 20444]KRN08736.1 ribonucleoside hydrolase 1 [Liquorilactobacillus mali KCTC 3596 = DSM 20444]MDC7954058.1 pyrimidine-specific ribonucleoside hydrolase RihA [Liquorilactobacillus mali]MDV7758764.1 pyrimidine-specific ribonucleoside hydrolase RihA [Liquorilactobacillus mali]QFQ75641.1 pyrimidine-specific ribonucleoside hydrolase RihA [Li
MKKIIIDCDPGHDDALALVMAVAAPELDILAVTTSAGNQTPDKTLNNAMRMLTLLKQNDIPVAGGNEKPLIQDLIIAENVHGKTGLDGAVLPEPDFAPVNIPAVQLIAETLNSSIDPVTLVVTGPMTNIALFLQIYPQLKTKIEQIVFMGGAMNTGNYTPSSEFNIAVDPESAKIVINSGIPLVMAGLNLTHQAQIYQDEVENIRKIHNEVARSIVGQLDFYGIYYGQDKLGFKGIPLHDPCTIAWLQHPEYFEGADYHVDVEVAGTLTRGETVVDRFNLLNLPQNVHVLTAIRRQQFIQLLTDAIASF